MGAKADIRITDPDTVRIVLRHQQVRGDATMSRTAANMIRERDAQLEQIGGRPLDRDAAEGDERAAPKRKARESAA